MTNTANVPVGLFDFDSYHMMVDAISETLGLPRDEIHERLFNEAITTGWNTTRAAQKFGITPHVFDELMEEFYERTDAFVFELLVGHLSPICQEIDRRVSETVGAYFDDPTDVQLLILGDGIGTDSLRFAVAGYHVTYFDFEGHTASLALYRFEQQDMLNQIQLIHQLDDIPTDTFDVVICREVLEHVEAPPEVIEDVWSYLKEDGIAIITESFNRVKSAFPTHLLSNQRYSGQTEKLFVATGFRLLKIFPKHQPLVFQKTTRADKLRWVASRVVRGGFKVSNLLRRVGRRIRHLLPV